jgi:small-conductance mechanosensitive channel
VPVLCPRRNSYTQSPDEPIGVQHSPTPAGMRLVFALALLLVAGLPVHSFAQNSVDQEPAITAAASPQNAVEKLGDIQESIEAKHRTVRELRKQLKALKDPAEAQELEQKIERLKTDIANLQESFEQIATGGIYLTSMGEVQDQGISWRDEVEQISRPLLSSLKELTAKPRHIDSLRRELQRQEDQLKIIDNALDSLRLFSAQSLPPGTAAPLKQLLSDWEQRRVDLQHEVEITRFKLNSLITQTVPVRTMIWEAIDEFARGRGLTLLLVALSSLTIWLLFKTLLALYWRWLYRMRGDIGVRHAPLVIYSYRLVTAVAIVLAILLVLYSRGDILLLTLGLIALAGVALGLRQTLPRYAADLRLLLGMGPVREQERLMLDGIPFSVESLGVYSVLRNPALEGVVRLPLHKMATFASRPATEEPWFPCQPGDYIVLADGSYGHVLRQTIEMVEVAVLDSRMRIGTREFLAQNIRNLSRDGFGIAANFGIDYQHHAICLDTVPARFREAIIGRFSEVGLGQDIQALLVEFSEAGASSLIYRIYLILSGRAAPAYYKAQRLIQQACVDTCNREGWVIPFTQVTVHSAEVPAL